MKIFLVLMMICAEAAAVPFTYQTDNCECTVQLDTSKISEVEARNALRLEFFAIEANDPIWPPPRPYSSDTVAANRKSFDESSAKQIKELENMKLPKSEKWKAFQRSRVEELQFVRYRGMTASDYLLNKKPEVLKAAFNGKTFPQKCVQFADAFQSTSTLIKKHREFMMDHCKNNASPTKCRAEAEDTRRIPMAAAIDLLALGWGNCLNEVWGRDASGGEALYEAANKELKQNFKGEKCICEDP